MTLMKSPAFQFYPGDFLVGTMGMTNEEVGIYIKLLAFQWERGGLPPEQSQLKTLVGSRKPIPAVVMAKFAAGDDGLLRNARMEAERSKQEKYRQSRADNAAKRWSTSNAHASPVHKQNESISHALLSSSSSSEGEEIPPAGFGSADDPAGEGPRPSRKSPKPPAVPPEDRVPAWRAAVQALDRWAMMPPPTGIGFQINPATDDRPLRRFMDELANEPPIPRGGELISRQMLVAQAADILAKKRKEFRSVSFACGCIKNELKDWANGCGVTNGRPADAPKRARELVIQREL